MKEVILQPDCTRCAALCCVALAFDQSRMFAIDKPAGEPCPNLDACGACTIHSVRAERGFRGCIDFDCFGAGQRVTQEFFAGRSWTEDRALVGPMSRAFSVLLRRHEQLLLLDQAEALDLSSQDRERLAALRTRLVDSGVAVPGEKDLDAQLTAFLASLRRYLSPENCASATSAALA